MNEVHNLDDQVQEFFEFTVKGNTYRFRHMNTGELEAMKEFKDDDEKSKEYIYSFITKVDEKSPDFVEIAKEMIAPNWKKFKEMMKVEFGA